MPDSRPAEVNSKSANYDLFDKGHYGNKLKTWPTVDAFLADLKKGRVKATSVSVRYKRPNSPYMRYDVSLNEVAAYAKKCQKAGAQRNLLVVNESAPDDKIVVQGELCQHPYSAAGWYFRYSFHKEKMRTALQVDERHAEGMRAQWLLKHHMTPSSWEDLLVLMEKYHTSVIELSVYSGNLGDTPGRNAVVWEIRTSY